MWILSPCRSSFIFKFSETVGYHAKVVIVNVLMVSSDSVMAGHSYEWANFYHIGQDFMAASKVQFFILSADWRLFHLSGSHFVGAFWYNCCNVGFTCCIRWWWCPRPSPLSLWYWRYPSPRSFHRAAYSSLSVSRFGFIDLLVCIVAKSALSLNPDEMRPSATPYLISSHLGIRT